VESCRPRRLSRRLPPIPSSWNPEVPPLHHTGIHLKKITLLLTIVNSPPKKTRIAIREKKHKNPVVNRCRRHTLLAENRRATRIEFPVTESARNSLLKTLLRPRRIQRKPKIADTVNTAFCKNVARTVWRDRGTTHNTQHWSRVTTFVFHTMSLQLNKLLDDIRLFLMLVTTCEQS
jgi:hypothetical protein